jgi:hypothetical protein
MFRSVGIVRNGYLVYEHYWRGLDQADGHDVRSVTKSVIGALVGIALAEGKIKRAWIRPSVSCWPSSFPRTPIPAWRGSPSNSC